MSTDDILNLLGGCGRFQMLFFLAVGPVKMFGSLFTFAPIYLGYAPPHHCRLPANATANQSIPRIQKDGKWIFDQCKMFNLSSPLENSTQPCADGWTYEWDSSDRGSFVSEWDLVCDKDYLTDLSTTMYMAGATVGSIFLTPFSDRFGRKWVMLVFVWAQGILGFGLAWADNIIVFTVGRFFIGALNTASLLIVYVMIVEVFPSSHRTLPSISFQCFWSFGVMTLALLGYLVHDWRYLEMVLSLPCLLTAIYAICLPESILWLISKGRYEDAEAIVRRGCSINKRTVPEQISTLLKEAFEVSSTINDTKPPEDTFSSSLRTISESVDATSRENLVTETIDGPSLIDTSANSPGSFLVKGRNERTIIKMLLEPSIRVHCLIVFYLFFVTSMSYFGTTFFTPTYGNRFVNLFISGAIEIPAFFGMIGINQLIGRRIAISIFSLLCSAMNIVVLFLPTTANNGEDLSWLKTTLIMIGKFGITGSFACIYLYASEIFPTTVRNHALGMASFFENIGGIFAPIVVYAAKRNIQIPLITFAVGNAVGGILVLLLPETHKRPLPQTIKEVVVWNRKKQTSNGDAN